MPPPPKTAGQVPTAGCLSHSKSAPPSRACMAWQCMHHAPLPKSAAGARLWSDPMPESITPPATKLLGPRCNREAAGPPIKKHGQLAALYCEGLDPPAERPPPPPQGTSCAAAAVSHASAGRHIGLPEQWLSNAQTLTCPGLPGGAPDAQALAATPPRVVIGPARQSSGSQMRRPALPRAPSMRVYSLPCSTMSRPLSMYLRVGV